MNIPEDGQAVRTFHHAAMMLADQANVLDRLDSRNRDPDALLRIAAIFERRAYDRVPDGTEPTRSVLFRSYLWLLINGGKSAEALAEAGATDWRSWAHPEIAPEIEEAVEAARQDSASRSDVGSSRVE